MCRLRSNGELSIGNVTKLLDSGQGLRNLGQLGSMGNNNLRTCWFVVVAKHLAARASNRMAVDGVDYHNQYSARVIGDSSESILPRSGRVGLEKAIPRCRFSFIL